MIIPPEIIGYAQATQRKWQIPSSLILSAAIIESDLGKKVPSGSNNWFGIKALHGQSQREAVTGEQTPAGDKFTIVAGFRVFPSIQAGFDAYGELLGLGNPYHDMVTKYLQSNRTPADVQALTNSLTGVYATAKDYGSALINVQKADNLYQYDIEKANPTSNASPAVATMPAPSAQAPAPGPVPTVSSSVTIDWGSFAAQLLENSEPIIAAAAQAGLNLALSEIPLGSLIAHFIGPTVISQYVAQGVTALAGLLKNDKLTIPASDFLATFVANAFNANEPQLAKFLGDSITPTIKAFIDKLKL
jgi:hypothetical protein